MAEPVRWQLINDAAETNKPEAVPPGAIPSPVTMTAGPGGGGRDQPRVTITTESVEGSAVLTGDPTGGAGRGNSAAADPADPRPGGRRAHGRPQRARGEPPQAVDGVVDGQAQGSRPGSAEGTGGFLMQPARTLNVADSQGSSGRSFSSELSDDDDDAFDEEYAQHFAHYPVPATPASRGGDRVSRNTSGTSLVSSANLPPPLRVRGADDYAPPVRHIGDMKRMRHRSRPHSGQPTVVADDLSTGTGIPLANISELESVGAATMRSTVEGATLPARQISEVSLTREDSVLRPSQEQDANASEWGGEEQGTPREFQRPSDMELFLHACNEKANNRDLLRKEARMFWFWLLLLGLPSPIQDPLDTITLTAYETQAATIHGRTGSQNPSRTPPIELQYSPAIYLRHCLNASPMYAVRVMLLLSFLVLPLIAIVIWTGDVAATSTASERDGYALVFFTLAPVPILTYLAVLRHNPTVRVAFLLSECVRVAQQRLMGIAGGHVLGAGMRHSIFNGMSTSTAFLASTYFSEVTSPSVPTVTVTNFRTRITRILWFSFLGFGVLAIVLNLELNRVLQTEISADSLSLPGGARFLMHLAFTVTWAAFVGMLAVFAVEASLLVAMSHDVRDRIRSGTLHDVEVLQWYRRYVNIVEHSNNEWTQALGATVITTGITSTVSVASIFLQSCVEGCGLFKSVEHMIFVFFGMFTTTCLIYHASLVTSALGQINDDIRNLALWKQSAGISGNVLLAATQPSVAGRIDGYHILGIVARRAITGYILIVTLLVVGVSLRARVDH